MRADYRAPSLQRLAELDAVNIGRAILPLFAQHLLMHGHSREPRWIARGIAQEAHESNPEAAKLIMEGDQALERSGMLVPDVFSDSHYRLSRAGVAAAAGRSSASSIARNPPRRSFIPPSGLRRSVISSRAPIGTTRPC